MNNDSIRIFRFITCALKGMSVEILSLYTNKFSKIKLTFDFISIKLLKQDQNAYWDNFSFETHGFNFWESWVLEWNEKFSLISSMSRKTQTTTKPGITTNFLSVLLFTGLNSDKIENRFQYQQIQGKIQSTFYRVEGIRKDWKYCPK